MFINFAYKICVLLTLVFYFCVLYFQINIMNKPISILVWKIINILTFIFIHVYIWSYHIQKNVYNMAGSNINFTLKVINMMVSSTA